jgi:Protein of unknown function (DUF2442)
MSSLVLHVEPCAQMVECNDTELIVYLTDGRKISAPIIWFPRLFNASTQQRKHYELLGMGEGIHWPEVDEDISVLGLLAGKPSVEFRPVA